MEPIIRRMPWSWKSGESVEPLVEREWLVTNGGGGYASGTLAGVCTRRYHGYLVSALPAPLGRMMMLNHLTEQIRLPDRRTVQIGGDENVTSGLDLRGVDFLQEFCLEAGLPMWRYRIDKHVLEKRVLMLHQQNTVHVNYRLVDGDGPVHMKLRLAVHFRPHDAQVSGPLNSDYVFCRPRRSLRAVGTGPSTRTYDFTCKVHELRSRSMGSKHRNGCIASRRAGATIRAASYGVPVTFAWS